MFCWSLEQVEYLTDRKYLLRMGTRGLIEGVADFENQFPESKISMHRVRKLYKDIGIKRRVLRVEIALTPAHQRR